MTTSPRQTPTDGSPDGKRRSPHHNTSPLGSECAHSLLVEMDKMKKKKNQKRILTGKNTDCALKLISWIPTKNNHVVSNDSGGMEGALSWACCRETRTERRPEPPVHVKYVSVVHPHAKPERNTDQMDVN